MVMQLRQCNGGGSRRGVRLIDGARGYGRAGVRNVDISIRYI